jgi:hypothetical protein
LETSGLFIKYLKCFRIWITNSKSNHMALGNLLSCFFIFRKKTGVTQFKRWIITSCMVLPMHENLGYNIGSRILTLAQVKAIVDEFGQL